MAVGMTDGLVSVTRRLDDGDKVERTPRVKYSFNEWEKVVKQTPVMKPLEEGDSTFEDKGKNPMPAIDRLLSSYRYSKALDAAMANYNTKRKPEVVVTLMQELIR